MYRLLNMPDIPERLETPPVTDGLTAQRDESMSTFEQWWRSILENGWITDEEWPEWVLKETVSNLYLEYFSIYGDRREVPLNPVHISRQLMRLSNNRISAVRKMFEGEPLGGISRSQGKRRLHIFLLPPLPECRTLFEEALGMEGKIDWENGYEPPPF